MRTLTIQLQIRLPEDVKRWLEDQSALNNSSQNSEVIRAIRAAMTRTKVQPTT